MDQRAIEIRLAGAADIEALFDIQTSVMENHISCERLQELRITLASIGEAILSAPCVWIAEINGKSAGFSMVDHTEGSISRSSGDGFLPFSKS